MEEIATWQLPPQINREDMATLMVHRPAARLADLQQTVDSHLLRSDQTAYGAAETRLAFQAMQVYEQRMTEHLSQI